MIKWLQKIHKSFMERKKMAVKYRIDKEAMMVFIDVNKSEAYIIGNDRNALETMVMHFTASGYCVIVRD